jgi:exonuclease III
MKLLSWNILGHNYLTLDNHQHISQKYPQVIDWSRRCQLLCATILKHSPDVICLQEVDMVRRSDFLAILSKHGFEESAYQEKGNGGVLVIHKQEKFEMLKNGHALLPTESKKGGCAWAVLKSKQSQKEFLVGSVHLHWHYSQEQIALLKDVWKNPITIPMMLVGDFNIPYKTMLDKIVPEVNQLNLVAKSHTFSLYQHQSWTFCEESGWRSADHALFSDDIKVDTGQSFIGDQQHSYKSDLVNRAEGEVPDTSKNPLPTDEYPSDHLPLVVSFEVS